ncbi:hypothetical protein [Methylobacterium sp. PvR107]|uniref:hypothetical protein n=1 Tax=Methylobacterium sp. PvR107 TaxID=2806597 RepID=UPI001AE65607|nr:hypothetical protein [Methylobacterium sp. PvR107]MBP1182344.1 hypothetical protein [Methylobacterium sp. PvR107]
MDRTPLPTRERAPVSSPPCRAALGWGRRAVALLALYAFALQTTLSGMAMAAAAGPEHVLCLGDAGQPGAMPDGKHLPAHTPPDCCAFCHAAGPAALPAPAPAADMPSPRPVAAPRTRPGGRALPRAPPRHGLGARAPPVA